jgi:hypothetical protein
MSRPAYRATTYARLLRKGDRFLFGRVTVMTVTGTPNVSREHGVVVPVAGKRYGQFFGYNSRVLLLRRMR